MPPPIEPPELAEPNRPAAFADELHRLRAERRFDLVLRGARVLTPAGTGAHEVGVRAGRVVAVEPLGAGLHGDQVVELAADETLLPGLVDAHVHVNEPGRTEWEGFATATRAAAAGGVTTILDMPLNSIPSTVTPQALELKQLVAAPQIHVDTGFWAGAVPGNLGELHALHEAGAFGFKCFLLHSGVDEFPPLDADQLDAYLRELSSFGAMMIVHAEDADVIEHAPQASGTSYPSFLASRPTQAEDRAITTVIERTRRTGAKAHVLHLSSADSLPLIEAAKHEGLDLSVETCPHYLTLEAEQVPAGGTAYKCCPPVRDAANRERLWEGLAAGTIDYIASDHSPSTPELKGVLDGDFGRAWGGIASVQLQLPLVWSEARRRGISLEQVVAWMSTAPAQRVGLATKGRIAVGYDADLAVFAPEEQFEVRPERLLHRHPVSPYAGRTLSGVVRRTFLRGVVVSGDAPHGQLLTRAR